MRIKCLGAAGEVTGSSYLVEAHGATFLVDCGMFQGGAEGVRKNLQALDFDLRRLDFVLLTHAHIDHSGLLPRLAVLGYRGPIYTTPATAELLGILLPDSAHVQEKEIEWQLRHRHKRGSSLRGIAPPLYTVTQAVACLRQLRGQPYGVTFTPHPGVRVRFSDAGHILGSAIIEIWLQDGGRERKVVFSGDLGQPARPVLEDPTPIEEADVLFVESTYGDRLHRPMEATEAEIVEAFHESLLSGQGNIIIPAFAVGRTQELLYVLTSLVRAGRLPPLEIHVDSPMAKAATELTYRHTELLDAETRELMAWQNHERRQVRVHFVEDAEESIRLNSVRQGAVIIAASGMCDAGRVKHHLRHNLPRPECTVLITGFQAAGSLGRRLVDGAPYVRMFGEVVPVRARIRTIGGLSAHADQQGLLDWLRHFRRPPRTTVVVHGEAAASLAFAAAIVDCLGWPAPLLPQHREVLAL